VKTLRRELTSAKKRYNKGKKETETERKKHRAKPMPKKEKERGEETQAYILGSDEEHKLGVPVVVNLRQRRHGLRLSSRNGTAPALGLHT
jgi:hypothetical protein